MVFQKELPMPLATRNWVASVISFPKRSRSCPRNSTTARKSKCINQKLGYLVRCGDPDAIDSIVPMAYGNLALDLLLNRHPWPPGGPQETGVTTTCPSRPWTATKKVVNVKDTSIERLRPVYQSFEMKPLPHDQRSWMTRAGSATCAPPPFSCILILPAISFPRPEAHLGGIVLAHSPSATTPPSRITP